MEQLVEENVTDIATLFEVLASLRTGSETPGFEDDEHGIVTSHWSWNENAARKKRVVHDEFAVDTAGQASENSGTRTNGEGTENDDT